VHRAQVPGVLLLPLLIIPCVLSRKCYNRHTKNRGWPASWFIA
jgi:hypothetical protein